MDMSRRRRLASDDAQQSSHPFASAFGTAKETFGLTRGVRGCTFTCPLHSTCLTDNGFPACRCDGDYEPYRHGLETDTCEMTAEVASCLEVDCSYLLHGECRHGACRCKQGYELTTSKHADGSVAVSCVWQGATATDPCEEDDAPSCPEHAECWENSCVCEARFTLQLDDDGEDFCDAVMPCDNVVCGAHSVCMTGVCHCQVGYRLAANGFDCEPHYPKCGFVNDDTRDEVSCFDGSSCVDMPSVGTVCVCDGGEAETLHFDRNGVPRCERLDVDPCGEIACLPGHVCERLPSGEYGCAPVSQPCEVDNGGCGEGAHCVVLPLGGWQCVCKEGKCHGAESATRVGLYVCT